MRVTDYALHFSFCNNARGHALRLRLCSNKEGKLLRLRSDT